MKLRYYQQEAVDSIFEYYTEFCGNPVIGLPTASGKSLVLAEANRRILENNHRARILNLTHSKELVVQDHEKLLSIWPEAPASVFSASLGIKQVSQITTGTIASVIKSLDRIGQIDYIFIDEAHLVSPREETMYNRLLKRFNVPCIGLTATPYRLGHGRIIDNHIFTDFSYDLTSREGFNRLIKEGFLCRPVSRKTSIDYDTSGVRVRNHEFVANELEEVINIPKLSRAIVKDFLERAEDRKHILIFCNSIKHAESVSQIINAYGVSCVSVSSKSGKDRDRNIQMFKDGAIRCMTNCDIMTTGVDFPALDCIVLMMSTMSTVRYVQALGRGCRIFEGKENFLVLDYGGNIVRLGPIDDPVVPRRKGESSGDAPVKVCPVCQQYLHISVMTCDCGYQFPPGKSKLESTASKAAILSIDDVPEIEEYDVKRITYSKHLKNGRASMKVTYFCGDFYDISEYVCIGYPSAAGKMAARWLRERNCNPDYVTIDDILDHAHELKSPSKLSVHVNKKYPSIVKYYF